jgi:hypothetical protein
MFSQLGTAENSAVAKYLAAKKVPTIAIVTGASKFTNVKEYPLTTTGLVSYDTEGKIYAKYLMPSCRLQNTQSYSRTTILAATMSTRSRRCSVRISTSAW